MIGLREPSGGSNRNPVPIVTLKGAPVPVDAEFKPTLSDAVFTANALPFGRCLGSKSGYRAAHPQAKFQPNANVFSLRQGKLWWGDLDLEYDRPALERIARRLRCRLFVLREFDGRWESGRLPPQEIVLRACWCTGGNRRVPGLGAYLRRAGLSARQVAQILSVSTATLTRLQAPEAFLELNRNLKYQEDYFGEVAAGYGYKKWVNGGSRRMNS